MMEAPEIQRPSTLLAPVAATERIEALDVVRGFALFGIFLMNVDFFNRPTAQIGLGMPPGLTGIDWLAGWFVAYFVQGKFWTIFSLLFGMGFAIMLTRAEQAGRPFVGLYTRRLIGLATFGAAHYIFLWAGDILFSYAVAAGGLLILLYGRWKPMLLAAAALGAVALVPGLRQAAAFIVVLTFIGLLGLYLRSDRCITVLGRQLPVFSLVLLIIAAVAALASPLLWLLPDAPEEARAPTIVMTIMILVAAGLSARFHDPEDLRSLRLGAGLYVFLTTVTILIGAIQYLAAPDTSAPVADLAVPVTGQDAARTQPDLEPAVPGSPSSEPGAGTDAAMPAAEAEDQKKKARAAERARQLEEFAAGAREEAAVMSKGSYLDALQFRAREFPAEVAETAGFSWLLIAMFLIGVWFVRSGVMADTRANLALFRNLAVYALPFGIGLGLLGSLIAVTHTPGDLHDGFQLAAGLAMFGNLPASLGYVGLVIVMLHSDTVFSKISALAPAGRMALTNYLAQSLVSTCIFYGYGLGLWGLPRSLQIVYVLVFFVLQVIVSRWWLKRYRYGPLEWVWRGFTYRQTPAMRR
jgi:uncharacterized membrane protein YeiB